MSLAVDPHEMKQFIIDVLALEDMRPEDIGDDEPLFREGLGLDSIDGLELSVALRKRFHIEFTDEKPGTWNHLATVRSLVAFLSSQGSTSPAVPTEIPSCS